MRCIEEGGCVNGNVIADAGCGVALIGSAQLNEITVPDGMEACMVIWAEDGNYDIFEYTETSVDAAVGG